MRLSGLRSIRAAKVEEYLLNEQHPQGGPKAQFFMRFGFTLEDPMVFEASLLRHPYKNEVLKVVETAMGVKSIVECNLVTPDGRNPCISTVWFKPHGSTAHRFVTAYPSKRVSS